jgi:nicotinate-nucleotide pyrophosphorylase (carboxylating)
LDFALERIVRAALEEDLGHGDLTTELTVDRGLKAMGTFLAKQELVVAGTETVDVVFRCVDSAAEVSWRLRDGETARAGDEIGTVKGRAAALLQGERTALNFLQRLSGVATLTRRFVERVGGTSAVILETRKTTPGMRLLEKRAVRAGGGRNHRMSLGDGILIKDNHIRLAGSVKQAVERAKSGAGYLRAVEVEVTSLAELREALDAGAGAILLDNMPPDTMAEAVRIVAGRVPIEASGGIHLDNVLDAARTGIPFISIGALTHSAPAVDISLEIEPWD